MKKLLFLSLLLPVSAIFSQIDTLSYPRYQLLGKDFTALKQIRDFSAPDLSGYTKVSVPYGGKLRVKTYVSNDTLYFNSFDGMTVRYGFLLDSVWHLTRTECLNKKTVFDTPKKLENDEKSGIFYGFVTGNPVPIIEIVGGKAYFNDIPINQNPDSIDVRMSMMHQNNQLNYGSDIVVYPNPARDFITVVGSGMKSYEMVGNGMKSYEMVGNCEIYDINGKLVLKPFPTTSYHFPQLPTQINTVDLKPGVYFLKIEDKLYKFVKQ